jgi:MYXO-CTERM domain-containing protein
MTKFVARDVSDPIGCWSAPQNAFTDDPADGVYHGAALSAVADGNGGLHLVYKDQNQMLLWYRHFDGSAFDARVQVDDSRDDWALQPATMLREGDLFILANHRTAADSYETRMWRLSTGLGAERSVSLGDDGAFHGYPTLPESIPADAPTFPYAFASTPDPDQAGEEVTLRVAVDPPAADVAAAPAALRSVDGRPASTTLSLLPRNGFHGTVVLSTSGAPANASVALTQTTLATAGGAMSTLLTLTPGDAAPGDYAVVVNAVSAEATASVTVPWTIAHSVPGSVDNGVPPTGTVAASPSASGCSTSGAQPAAGAAILLMILLRRRRGLS